MDDCRHVHKHSYSVSIFCVCSGGDDNVRVLLLAGVILRSEGMRLAVTSQRTGNTLPLTLLDAGVVKTLPKRNKERGGLPKLTFTPSPTKFSHGAWQNRARCIYVPLNDIGFPLPKFFDPANYVRELPNSTTLSGEDMCVMVAPLLRGSTFYIRADWQAATSATGPNAPPPSVCLMQDSGASAQNDNLSSELYRFALKDARAMPQV